MAGDGNPDHGQDGPVDLYQRHLTASAIAATLWPVVKPVLEKLFGYKEHNMAKEKRGAIIAGENA